MAPVDSRSKTQVQRAKGKDYYGMNGVQRLHDPDNMLAFILGKMRWQNDRLEAMNPDPTGIGLANSMRAFELSAAKGLLLTVMHICAISRGGLTSNIAVPAASRNIASWLRDQIGSANFPMDSLDSLGVILGEYV